MKKKLLIIGGNSSVSKSFQKLFNKNYLIYLTTTTKKNSKKNCFFLDLNNDVSILEFVKHIKKIKFDNILITSGIIYGKTVTDYNFEKINTLFNINVIGVIKILSKLLSKKTKKKMNIIFISSISERKGSFDEVYASSKSAFSKIAKSLSINYGSNLRVNVIAPSVINKTKMYRMMSKKNINKILNSTPNKKILNCDDLAKIINDIFQDHWIHSNGSIIDVNGGLI